MKYLLSVFFSFFCIQLLAQKNNLVIYWSHERKLVWDDFKASPPKNSPLAAVTNTHIGFSFYYSNNKLNHSIDCHFNQYNSWGIVKTDFILQHEQGHFDIAEIFARKLKKSIVEYQFNSTNYRNDLDTIFEKITTEESEFQKLYDNETNHSRNKQRQFEWVEKITQQLNLLNSYSNYR